MQCYLAQIRQKTALRAVLRMRYIMPGLRTHSGQFTAACHGNSPLISSGHTLNCAKSPVNPFARSRVTYRASLVQSSVQGRFFTVFAGWNAHLFTYMLQTSKTPAHTDQERLFQWPIPQILTPIHRLAAGALPRCWDRPIRARPIMRWNACSRIKAG